MATFLKNINMVSRSATMFVEQQLGQSCEIKGNQTKYILTICSHPGISQDALSKMLFVNKSSVARQITALEEGGYVTRREEPSDKRVWLVFPTEKAKELLPIIRGINAKWREVITEGFSEEEKALLLDLTQRLYENAVAYMEAKK